VGLVTFSDTPRVQAPATTDREALRRGLRGLAARGETALYDAVVLAAGQAGPKGNLVILSDGGDTVSRAGLGPALDAVRAGGLHADVIAFRTGESDTRPLEAIAAAGNGRVVRARDAAGLARAFAAAAVAVPLDVTAPAGPSAVTGAAPDVPAALPAAPAVVQVVTTPRWFTPWRLVGPLAVLLGLVVVGLAWPHSPAEIARRRRRQVLEAYDLSVADETARDQRSAVTFAAAGMLKLSEQIMAAGGRQRSVALRLDRAGLALLPHEWVTLRVSVLLVGGAVGLLLVHPRPLGLIVGAAVGWTSTGLVLRVRQARRCRTFAEQLPDTLQTVASSLRSGFSLQQALAATQETVEEPMSSELGRALAAARIGVVLEDELDQIALRMRSHDWHLAVMAIRIQRSVGGNLAEVLSTTARTLRERAAVARQVRALSAEGRLSAYVLLALPVGVGLFLVAFRREYVEPLWTTAGGIVMLVVSAIGMTVGTLWMLKVAEVEV
jgi:tight adherence protein B